MPRVKVRVPVPLQKLAGDQDVVEAEGASVAEVLADLERRYPGFASHVQDEQGAVRRYINVFVNDENIRSLDNERTAVKDGDEISLIPAIAGGD
jgi:molybdopterin synthase sulfur carrier subunit